MNDAVVRIDAPAKLTLSLRITGIRDDGYHLIDAEMISLDHGDILEITPSEHTHLTAEGPFSAGMPLDDTNLVAKALRLAGRTASVHLHKYVPHGGGLGGGEDAVGLAEARVVEQQPPDAVWYDLAHA